MADIDRPINAKGENKLGILALAVFFVLSGAISREINKKLNLDIRLISMCMGMFYGYVLSHYGIENEALDQISTIVPNVSEFLFSSYLITTTFSIEFKK